MIVHSSSNSYFAHLTAEALICVYRYAIVCTHYVFQLIHSSFESMQLIVYVYFQFAINCTMVLYTHSHSVFQSSNLYLASFTEGYACCTRHVHIV